MISSVAIVQNEEKLVRSCVKILDWTDDIVVLDGGSVDRTVEILKSIENPKLRVIKNKFKGHFGDQKNTAISQTKGDWVFVLDADETIEKGLIEELKEAAKSKKYDVVYIPRKNYIDGELTEAYPDYQLRFFRAYCRYIYSVHEELVGWKRSYIAKKHILHYKTNERQESQNVFYSRNAVVTERFTRTIEERSW